MTIQKQHYPLLDGLRGIAAIAVMAFHGGATFHYDTAPGSYLAVDFFFVLSGFVISFAYGNRIRNGMTWRHYRNLRLVRLYPMYLVGLLLGISVELYRLRTVHGSASDMLSVLITGMLNAFYIPTPRNSFPGLLFPYNFPAWSLSWELLACAAYFYLARERAIRAIVGIMAASGLALIAIALHRGQISIGAAGWGGIAAVVRVGFSFSAGVLLFELAFRERVIKPIHGATAVVLIATLGFIFIAPIGLRFQAARDLISVGLLFPLIVYFAARINVSSAFRAPVRIGADASYPLYVLHAPILGLFVLVWNPVDGHAPSPSVMATIEALIFVLAFGWARIFDEPVRKWLTARMGANASRTNVHNAPAG